MESAMQDELDMTDLHESEPVQFRPLSLQRINWADSFVPMVNGQGDGVRMPVETEPRQDRLRIRSNETGLLEACLRADQEIDQLLKLKQQSNLPVRLEPLLEQKLQITEELLRLFWKLKNVPSGEDISTMEATLGRLEELRSNLEHHAHSQPDMNSFIVPYLESIEAALKQADDNV